MIASGGVRNLVLAGVVAWPLLAPDARATTPLGGLTVAVSAKGDKLVAAGDTRTLLVMDPKSLSVRRRIWIESTVVALAFDRSGATLAVLDTDDTVSLYDSARWRKKHALRKRDGMTVAVAAGLFAGVETTGQGHTIYIHSLDDGAEKGKLSLPKGSKIASFGLSADGKRLAVLVGPIDAPAMPKLSSSDIPKNLRGAARDEFVQKNDGKESQLVVYDVPTGKAVVNRTLFYSFTDGVARTVLHGDDVIFVNYSNVGARIAPDGAVKIFKTENGFNYGIGAASDNGLIMTGGLRTFSLTRPDTLVGVKGELPRLPGWPEYFKGFDATPEADAIYGATSAYRVVRIGADGKILAVEPVR